MENKNYLYNNYLNMARNLRTEGNLLKSLSFYKKAYGLNIGKMDTELIMDMALIYAMLGFVTVVIVCKAYLRSHHKDRANDLANLKKEDKE